MGPFNPFQQMQQPFGASGAMPDALAYLRNYWGQPQQPMQTQPTPTTGQRACMDTRRGNG